jgi:hypothetical protein
MGIDDKASFAKAATSRGSAKTVVTALWFAGMWVAFAGFSLASLARGLILILLSGLGYWIETRTVRPLRSWLRVALASALLFCILVVSVSNWGGSIGLGAITWAIMTGLAAFWAYSYERIEPRS